jgi:class 3 adenylate cyclase
MYCDISGFTKMSAVLQPAEVIAMLNRLFTAFEAAAIRNGVFKVQTIGDCFVAVAGLPYVDEPWEPQQHTAAAAAAVAAAAAAGAGPAAASAAAAAAHLATTKTLASPFATRRSSISTGRPSGSGPAVLSPKRMSITIGAPGQHAAAPSRATPPGALPPWPCLTPQARNSLPPRQHNTAAMLRLAFDMCAAMSDMPPPSPHAPPMGVRIGLHTGSIIGGVIGSKAFRYDIFGKDVLAANCMESSGCPGGVLLSQSAAAALRELQTEGSGEYAVQGLKLLHRGKVFAEGIGSIDTYFASAPGCEFTDAVRRFAAEAVAAGGSSGGGH